MHRRGDVPIVRPDCDQSPCCQNQDALFALGLSTGNLVRSPRITHNAATFLERRRMKVITQLIRHFWERGVLSHAEIDYLLQHGFVRLKDVPGYQPKHFEASAYVDDVPPEPPDELELYEESLVRRTITRRGPHEPQAAVLTIDELLERLRSDYERRGVDLASVLSLGRRIAPVTTWQEAVSELHAATPDRFHAELCQGLQDGMVLLGDIWQASDPEPFHRLIHEEEMRGRAVRAFLALLVSSGPSELGSYSWILKHDEVQALINLRVVHERLLAGLSRIYQENRGLLTRAMARNTDLVQVWSLLLMYNAYREPALGASPDYGVEYGPLALPDDSVWRYAWTCALRMDRPVVSKFLVACYNEDRPCETDDQEACRQPLMCPVGWRIPDAESP